MLTHYQVSEDSDSEVQSDFEVVPQESNNAEMWDVNNENEDELKSSQIKSIPFATPWHSSRLIDGLILIRVWSAHGRGSVTRSRPCQPKKDKNRAYK
jgi:hypothetical protein